MEYTEKVAWLRRYRESLRQEQLLGEEIGQLEAQARRSPGPSRGCPAGEGTARPFPGRWSGWKKPARSWPGCWNRIRPSGPRSRPPSKRSPSPAPGYPHPAVHPGPAVEKIAAAHHLVLRQVFRLHHQAVDGLDL